MTREVKLNHIKTLLQVNDTSADALLESYLELAKEEILNWLYQMKGNVPVEVTDVPRTYEVVQINAVVAGYAHNGAEGELIHNENGINRTFKYEDMISYIHAHVIPYAGV